jgi:Tol biopolymer transport system component
MQENTCDVFAVAPDGSGLRKLAERASMPAFSPDGGEIAFVGDRDENGTHRTGSDEQAFANDLYVMDADGSDVRRLTETESLDEQTPAWYPDGSVIAYAREGPNDFEKQLMLVKADGSCETRIAGDASARNAIETPSFEQPAWRPGRITGEAPALDC